MPSRKLPEELSEEERNFIRAVGPEFCWWRIRTAAIRALIAFLIVCLGAYLVQWLLTSTVAHEMSDDSLANISVFLFVALMALLAWVTRPFLR